MSFLTDHYAYKIAFDYGFYPIESVKHEPLDLADNNWNFRFGKEYEDGTNILFAINGDELDIG